MRIVAALNFVFKKMAGILCKSTYKLFELANEINSSICPLLSPSVGSNVPVVVLLLLMMLAACSKRQLIGAFSLSMLCEIR